MVEIFPLHRKARSWNYRLFQELMTNGFLFLAETWFTLNLKVDKQNNKNGVLKTHTVCQLALHSLNVKASCPVSIYTIMGPMFLKES